MAYSKQTWASGPEGGTPLSPDRLNHLENGVQAAAATADSAQSAAASAQAAATNAANAGTSAATANTLVRRGPAGEVAVGNLTVASVDPAVTGAQPYQKQQVDGLLGSLPTLDELFSATYLGHIAPATYHVFVAPFPLRVAQVSLMTWTAVATSTANYYTFELRRARAGTLTTFAAKSTNTADGAGGQAIAINTDWNFDNIPFEPAVSQFAKGDGLMLRMALTGTAPVTNLQHCSITVRYVPL